MKGCIFLICKFMVMCLNIFLINFIPSTPTEFRIFCASRLVLFIMVFMDYIGVLINNKGVERVIGAIGVLIVTLLISFELIIMSDLVLVNKDYTYIYGNDDNYLTSIIPKIPLDKYLLFVFGSVLAILGLETLNHGGKTIYNSIKQINEVGDENADS